MSFQAYHTTLQLLRCYSEFFPSKRSNPSPIPPCSTHGFYLVVLPALIALEGILSIKIPPLVHSNQKLTIHNWLWKHGWFGNRSGFEHTLKVPDLSCPQHHWNRTKCHPWCFAGFKLQVVETRYQWRYCSFCLFPTLWSTMHLPSMAIQSATTLTISMPTLSR